MWFSGTSFEFCGALMSWLRNIRIPPMMRIDRLAATMAMTLRLFFMFFCARLRWYYVLLTIIHVYMVG